MPQYKSKTVESKPTRIKQYIEGMPDDVKSFLALARDRFKIAADAEAGWRLEALDDLRFLVGDQWPQSTKQARDQANRPCLTINRLPAIKRQLVNEQRAQRPAIVVRPVGNGADVDSAEMLEGLIRHIEVQSDVEIADDTAFEHMVTGGRGYVEVCADYLPGKTFDQELYVKRVKNPFTCYCDPASVQPDESDAQWKFEICDYPKEEYRARFGDSDLAGLPDFMSIGDNFPQWGDSKTIRVAKYWVRVAKDDVLYKLDSGDVLTKTEYDLRHVGMSKGSEKLRIVAERPYCSYTATCYVINAIEILDEYIFPGKMGYIPLIPCLGEDFDVNGVRHLAGIIREAKDPQRSINYFRSYAAETIALAPKAPFIGWKGQFKDAKWATANVVNYAYLEADTVTSEGTPAPSLPQRNSVEPPIQAVLALSQVIDGDLKAVTGIYEPSMGEPKGDQSGKAITSLQGQSQLTNLNFTDNLTRMKRHVGRVLLDAAPFIYDAPRIQRIINPDGSADMVIVHSGRTNAAERLKTPEISEVYDLSMGSYDVIVDVGKDYKTRRNEAFEEQSELAAADRSGKIFEVAADIIIGNSDMPGAREIAKRMRKVMPPALFTDDSGDPRVQLQQATATIQQLEQQNIQLMKQNADYIDTIKTEQVQQNAKIEVAKLQAAAQVEVAGINARMDEAKLDFQKFELIHGAAHDRAMGMANQATDQTGEPGAEEASGDTGSNVGASSANQSESGVTQ